MLRIFGAGALAFALLIPHQAQAAPPGPCKVNQVIMWAWSLRIVKCLDKPEPIKRASKRQHSGEITDVSAARRVHRGRVPSAHRDPDRMGGRRYAGHGSRAAGSPRPPARLESARPPGADRDGRGYASAPAGVSAPVRAVMHRRPAAVARGAVQGAAIGGQVAVEYSRPAECRGIAWCGCWLKKILGIPDPSLNLAINWARVGSAASPDSANVVVWRHHVGKLLKHEGGRILIQSGNDRGAVRTRWVSPGILGGVVAWRRV